ncbi:MAG: hypothetical protein ACD_34C00241G0002 [uncultured bacterium]|nr:MAG: hypothetical protein ACD_34C00241G0002 [uncultured bacterium]HCS38028.1 hypothetical protein [Anaerolineaceae bacterium]
MNQKKVKLVAGDLFIVVLFAILPAIRGYANWQIHEYILWAILAAILIFVWHKKNREPDKE